MTATILDQSQQLQHRIRQAELLVAGLHDTRAAGLVPSEHDFEAATLFLAEVSDLSASLHAELVAIEGSGVGIRSR